MSVSWFWRDGLSTIEELCLIPVPKPGPCPGHRRSGGGTKRSVTRKTGETTSPRTPRTRKTPTRPAAPETSPRPTESPREDYNTGYTGPVFRVSPSDQELLDEYLEAKKARDALSVQDDGWRAANRRFESARDDLPTVLRNRVENEQSINEGIDYFRTNRFPGDPVLSPEEARSTMAAALKKGFSDKRIATRVTNDGLAKILADGRFKTQHETKEAGPGSAYAPKRRRDAEAEMFGIPDKSDPTKRPIYGYVALNGVDDPVGDGRLEMYGPTQVVFKDDVRRRTTAMVGDSLNDATKARPSPVNSPEPWSFNPSSFGYNYERDFGDRWFRMGDYAEAQIHDGVSVSDIDEVVFQDEPPAALRDGLDKAGVKWRTTPRA